MENDQTSNKNEFRKLNMLLKPDDAEYNCEGRVHTRVQQIRVNTSVCQYSLCFYTILRIDEDVNLLLCSLIIYCIIIIIIIITEKFTVSANKRKCSSELKHICTEL